MLKEGEVRSGLLILKLIHSCRPMYIELHNCSSVMQDLLGHENVCLLFYTFVSRSTLSHIFSAFNRIVMLFSVTELNTLFLLSCLVLSLVYQSEGNLEWKGHGEMHLCVCDDLAFGSVVSARIQTIASLSSLISHNNIIWGHFNNCINQWNFRQSHKGWKEGYKL